jgi:hypothetical protein
MILPSCVKRLSFLHKEQLSKIRYTGYKLLNTSYYIQQVFIWYLYTCISLVPNVAFSPYYYLVLACPIFPSFSPMYLPTCSWKFTRSGIAAPHKPVISRLLTSFTYFHYQRSDKKEETSTIIHAFVTWGCYISILLIFFVVLLPCFPN